MHLKKIDIYRLKIPLCMPVKHFLAEHHFAENIIVKITTRQDVTGFGEGVPREFVTGEKVSESIACLENSLWPRAKGLPIAHPADVLDTLSEILSTEKTDRVPAVCCALESAILDAAGKTWNMSVADFFGPKDQSLCYSAVLPLTPPDVFNGLLRQTRDVGMTQVKIKVGDELDLERLKSARRILGPDVDIRVDANSAWTSGEATGQIEKMMAYGISSVEQPVGAADLDGFLHVAENTTIPIVADESMCTHTDAEQLAKLGEQVIFNLRLSKCGGIQAAHRIYEMGRAHGVASQLGCQVGETSILAAAGQQFALTHELRHLEGAYSRYLLKEDVVDPPVSFGPAGSATPSPWPGLGLVVNEKALDRLAVMHQAIS